MLLMGDSHQRATGWSTIPPILDIAGLDNVRKTIGRVGVFHEDMADKICCRLIGRRGRTRERYHSERTLGDGD